MEDPNTISQLLSKKGSKFQKKNMGGGSLLNLSSNTTLNSHLHSPRLRIGFKAALRWLQWWWIAKSWTTQPQSLVVPWFWISSAVFSSFSWVSMFFPMVCVVCGDPCGDELLKPGPLNLTHPSHLHQLVPSLFLPHYTFCWFYLEMFTKTESSVLEFANVWFLVIEMTGLGIWPEDNDNVVICVEKDWFWHWADITFCQMRLNTYPVIMWD